MVHEPLDDGNGGDSGTLVQKPLTSSQRKVIQNIHNDCGHASKEEFLRSLRLSRARPEVLDYVRREFECPACTAKGHPPKPRLPAALPLTFRLNETLGVDLLSLSLQTVPESFSATWLCWGTLYQLCIPFLDKTAEAVAKCVAERWIQYFWSSHVDHCRSWKRVCGQMAGQRQLSEDLTPERQLSNQTRERTIERAHEPPTQRLRLENPASSIRWSRVDDPRHQVPATDVEDEENMWIETDSEVLWQQQVDDPI